MLLTFYNHLGNRTYFYKLPLTFEIERCFFICISILYKTVSHTNIGFQITARDSKIRSLKNKILHIRISV